MEAEKRGRIGEEQEGKEEKGEEEKGEEDVGRKMRKEGGERIREE